MVFNDKEKEVFEKLEKYTKELTKDQYNYEILSGAISSNDFDILIEHIEKQIVFMNGYPDSKKRFEIMKGFFQKLEFDKLYYAYKEKTRKNGFNDSKKVIQGAKAYYDNTEKF
ncbi:MAG TPA: hypothetical protein VKB83_04200, partial [Nitrosopumilaceae archaeon]|nr:hypothetical protein [Nitrosopumilaceae archaeon]